MLPGETIMSGAPKDSHVSEFQVMESPAGWYIGTIWTACSCANCAEYLGVLPLPFQEPYSRETGYFRTEAGATKALEDYKKTGLLEGMRT